MKHLIQFWPGDWVRQMANINEAVFMKNCVTMNGGGKWLVHPLKGKSSGNVLVVFYMQLPMVRKYTSFGVNYQNILVSMKILNYEEMFVETPIYIKVCCAHYRHFYIYACH